MIVPMADLFVGGTGPEYRVLKYDLNAETELGTPVRVSMQAWRRFLSVGWQPRRPQDRPSLAELDVALVVWAEAEPGAGADRFVVVLPTGAPVPPNGTYIGTAQLEIVSGQFVVHVYDLGPAEASS
jgi:hypothetical protein